MSLLEVKNLSYSYGGNIAIRDISLSVEEGEVVTVIGPNGAGKTTTANNIVGTLSPDAGSIKFNDEDITMMDPHKGADLGISLVPEDRRLFPHMTVRENLKVSYSATDRQSESFDEQLGEMFDLFPRLAEREEQKVGTMSGGEQQMISMARSLITEPELLILDEPSLGLMPTLVTQVFDIIDDISAAGTTTLLIEQNVRQALEHSDRGYMLEQGDVAFSDESTALLEQDRVREAYLGM
jgi:branched-chain amino acid transport system ATP-binding protein